MRTKTKTLGSNVALLQTRLDFTESYVNTLQTGADKLTLADLNEEGALLFLAGGCAAAVLCVWIIYVPAAQCLRIPS